MFKKALFLMLFVFFTNLITKVPAIIIHGGLKQEVSDKESKEYSQALKNIIKKTYEVLVKNGPREAVVQGISLLEDNALFNAGTGSRLQKDGKVRMSAGLMSGTRQKFAAVITIEDVKNPIQVANLLFEEKYSVLAGKKATDFARNNKVPFYDPRTKVRVQEYYNKQESEMGTVGVVAVDSNGEIWVGTSTGGLGYEMPGRVADSGTVAGTYASKNIGISCTGKGEEIINNAFAVKIATRVDDGLSIKRAAKKTSMQAGKSKIGCICLDKNGNFFTETTDKQLELLYAYYNGKELILFNQER